MEGEEDLRRQVIKSDTCVFRIENIDLEIPAGRGQLTNLEGILLMVQNDLKGQQDERKQIDPELYEKVDDIIKKLFEMISCTLIPFTISLDDPAGNSWVEPNIADGKGKRVKHDYSRTLEQNAVLGLPATGEDHQEATHMRPEYRANRMQPRIETKMPADNADDDDIIENKVYTFLNSCSSCRLECETNMKMVNIPYFKEIVLISTFCNYCGCKHVSQF